MGFFGLLGPQRSWEKDKTDIWRLAPQLVSTSRDSKACAACSKVPGGRTSGQVAFGDSRQWAKGSHAVTLRNKTKSTELGVILRGEHALTPEGKVNKVSVDGGFIKPCMQGDGQPHLKCMVLAYVWMWKRTLTILSTQEERHLKNVFNWKAPDIHMANYTMIIGHFPNKSIIKKSI